MRWSESKALVVQFGTTAHRYFCWVRTVDDARTKLRSAMRRHGPVAWAAVFDDHKLTINTDRDWQVVSPKLNADAVLHEFEIGSAGVPLVLGGRKYRSDVEVPRGKA